MSPLQVALDDYLAMRRALGYKLRLSGSLLRRFVTFADEAGATYITTEIAVDWATQRRSAHNPPNGQIAWEWFAVSRYM